MSDHPEIDKMLAVQDESQAIGGFLEWMVEQDICLCKFNDTDSYNGEYIPDNRNGDQILADHFNIDLNKVEKERQAMLDKMRSV